MCTKECDWKSGVGQESFEDRQSAKGLLEHKQTLRKKKKDRPENSWELNRVRRLSRK